MTWDEEKEDFETRPNIGGKSKLPADEWNTHVADQKSRVKYGPIADRPAAGDVPDGTVWLVTDLANDGGVLTEVITGAWEIKSLGDSLNRIPDVFADKFDGNTIDVSQIINTSGISLKANGEINAINGGSTTAHRYEPSMFLNGESESFGFTQAMILVRVDNSGAQAGISLYSDGGTEAASIIWDPANAFSTTQGNTGTVNVFYDGGYVLENQTGGEIDVSIHRIS
jgi:hypothetical protein